MEESLRWQKRPLLMVSLLDALIIATKLVIDDFPKYQLFDSSLSSLQPSMAAGPITSIEVHVSKHMYRLIHRMIYITSHLRPPLS